MKNIKKIDSMPKVSPASIIVCFVLYFFICNLIIFFKHDVLQILQ